MEFDWFSPLELAEMALPDMGATERAVQLLADRRNWREPKGEYPANPTGWWRRREGRGGGYEYHLKCLPMRAQRALAMRAARAKEKPKSDSGALWSRYERVPDRMKDKARTRFEALDAVDTLCRAGMQRDLAMMQVANRSDIALRTLYNWAALVAGKPKGDWLPALVPNHVGRQATADIPLEAFDELKLLYLRSAEPAFSACYRELQKLAKQKGWTLPSARTLERRLFAEVPHEVMVLHRQGPDALKRLYPAQRRTKHEFHALQAVNADAHTFDVRVKTDDGRVVRPVVIAFQDLYSGKILSWRIGESANAGMTMLAFGDIVDWYGIPDLVWFDNGREFAAKWITGQTKNRYRFKLKTDEIPGLMNYFNVEVHFTQPYSGQSKPIERAFRDFASDISKHPNFDGAYTGKSTTTKPHDYGSQAVDWDVFERTVAEGIAEHNAREGRRSLACRGKLSFDAAFKASYEAPHTVIRKANGDQRRLWLLAAEGVTIRRDQPMIHLMGNRYWSDFIPSIAGKKVIVRFDPNDLHQPLHVYALDGGYLGAAACVDNAGFADQTAKREHNQARKAYMRAVAEQYSAEKRMGLLAAAKSLPPITPEPVEAKVIRPSFGNLALKPAAQDAAEETIDVFTRGVAELFPFRRPSPDG